MWKRNPTPVLCDPTTVSGAWISPAGTVINLDDIRRERGGGDFSHEDSARELLGMPPREDDPDEIDTGEWGPDAVDKLIDVGWIRVSNAVSIDCDESITTPVAMAAFASMLADCVTGKHLNPDDRIFVGLRDGNWQPTIDELVNDWGGRKMSEEMYAKLLGEATHRGLRSLVRHYLEG